MKRFAWIFVAVLTLFLLFSPRLTPVVAQAWRDSPFGTEYDAADTGGEVNAGAYVDRTTKGNMAAIACMIFPFGPSSNTATDGLCTNDMSRFSALYSRSAIGVLNKGIELVYSNPPANLALWVQDTGQTLGFLPKQVYAQAGIGFGGLSSLLPIWKAFRNVAYLVLAVVMIVIGFMVMFRKKIDPKTVVTVQNALPRIVITLLIITFSYAIVGIMVDLMYVSILLIAGIFQSTGLLSTPSFPVSLLYPTNQGLYSEGGLLAIFGNLFSSPDNSPFSMVLKILGLWNVGAVVGATVLVVLGSIVTVATGGAAGLLIAAPVAVPILIALLMSLALLFILIRLFILFLVSYIQIIIALIFGPLELVLEAVPGSNAFSNWLKNLFSNFIAFPVGAAIFMLSAIFANISNQGGGSLWTPPYTPLVSSSVTAVSALVSISLLFTIPSIVGQIKEALKSKPFVSAGPGAIVAPIGGVVQTGMSTLSQFYYGQQVLGGLFKKKSS